MTDKSLRFSWKLLNQTGRKYGIESLTAMANHLNLHRMHKIQQEGSWEEMDEYIRFFSGECDPELIRFINKCVTDARNDRATVSWYYGALNEIDGIPGGATPVFQEGVRGT